MRPTVLQLDDLPPIAVAGIALHPVRRALGVTALGINAFSADAGEHVVEDHDETGGGSGGHEELYVVVRGRATFTLDGVEHDVPAVGFVFVPETTTRRAATAVEDGTVVLALGGPAGAAGPPSPWEHHFVASAETDPARAYAVAAEGLSDHPHHGSLHYELACFAARAGDREQALTHLRVALDKEPRARRWAADDSDLDLLAEDLRTLGIHAK